MRAKGLIQIAILKEIEKVTGKRIHELFDMIVATSVGTILGGPLACGVSAVSLFDTMYEEVDNVFDTTFWRSINFFGNGKYSKKPVVKVLRKYIDKNAKMRSTIIKLISTSYCVNDGRNHYFKSWEIKDGSLNLIDAINRSYAAPYYFDPINDDKEKKTWLDGGIGDSNCSIDQAWIEAERLGWLKDEEVVILSIGTGYSAKHIPYKKSKKYRNIRSVAKVYLNPGQGGAARAQAVATKMAAARAVERMVDNLTIVRLDTRILSKIDKLDKAKYKDKYVKIGEKLAAKLDYRKLGL